MMLVITGYVMKLAPIAVCASVAASSPGRGRHLLNFAKFLGGFLSHPHDPVGHFSSWSGISRSVRA